MIEKENHFAKELLLCSAVLVTLISMPINKHESQWLVARKNLLLTNDTLFQRELVCLQVHMLAS